MTTNPDFKCTPLGLFDVEYPEKRYKRYTTRPNALFNDIICTAGNWTKPNSTELFSSVRFPAVHWTGDDLRRFGDEIGGHRRFFTIRTHLWIGQSTQCLSLDENRRRAATTARLATAVAALSTAVAGSKSRTCDGRRRSSPVQCRPTAENWTELNWTERSRHPVQLSWVFRCALGFSSLAKFSTIQSVAQTVCDSWDICKHRISEGSSVDQFPATRRP